MPSLKIVRTTCNLNNGYKRDQIIVDIRHRHQDTLYKLYDLLLSNDALDGGDVIFYTDPMSITQRYHLCLICRKRAIENAKQIHCSACVKNNLSQSTSKKPSPDYKKFYRY